MIPIRAFAVTIAAVGLLGSGLVPSRAAGVAAKGAGATFPQPAYVRWAALYAAETGDTVAYDGVGSGAGRQAIEAATVAFGASDTPLGEAALKDKALVQVPTLVGGVVPVVDLPGVGPGDLVLDEGSLLDLFMGGIDFWDDPDIRRLNPHLPLPHLAVTPVRRSDTSGTTAVFAAYLSRSARADQPWIGQDPPVLRPIGIAAEGGRGVADAVAATPGAIGYLGFDVAQSNRLAYADLVNPAGRIVQPTLASIAAAAEGADWWHGLTPSPIAQPGGASWPIVSATYVLMRRFNTDTAAASTAVRLFLWASRFGGPAAEDLGFVPLPEAASTAVRRRLADVGDASGRSLVP